MKKIALITGTSTGLGISIAIQLAQKGFKVFATMRNMNKQSLLQEAVKNAGVSLEVKELDVQDMSSIEQCVAEIIQQEGHIDVLVNNAGAGFVRTTEQATEKEIQWVMDVNFMGVVRCTKAVIPHMRKAKSGHIINISSVGGLVGQPFNEIYCAAKFAVEGYTESMASYIQPSFNINFTTVEPGGISSEFATNALLQFQSAGGMKEDEYQPILEKYIGGAQSRSKDVYQTSDQVAEIVIECIDNPTPPVRIRTSAWAEEFCDLKTQLDPTGKLLQKKVINTFL
jgi:NAD(P)-dependent dehydrogenase (short-subunit alcohol dehydrogenase family)